MGGSPVRLLGSQPRVADSNPTRAGGKNISTTSPPICKTVPGLVLGSKVTGCVSSRGMALVGLQVPTPAVGGAAGPPPNSLLGFRRLHCTSTQYLLSAQVSRLVQVYVTTPCGETLLLCVCVSCVQ